MNFDDKGRKRFFNFWVFEVSFYKIFEFSQKNLYSQTCLAYDMQIENYNTAY